MSLDRVVRFAQLAPVVVQDQAGRDVCILYALDSSGCAWVCTATEPWQRVAQPADSSDNPATNMTRGKEASA